MSTPEYHMDSGSADQLPKGGAQQLNQASSGAAQAPGNQPQNLPEPATPERAAPQAPSLPGLSGDREKFLYGATERPNEDPRTGMTAPGRVAPPPQAATQWLPTLAAAAADPNAPPTIKALYAALANLQ